MNNGSLLAYYLFDITWLMVHDSFIDDRLRGGQEVQMPVWFFVDPKFSEDPMMV
jgi:hypothetical protein